MIPTAVLLSLLVLAATLLGSGVAMAMGPRARFSGVLLALAAVAGFVGIWLIGDGHRAASYVPFAAGGLLLVPLALVAYPRLLWRAPVFLVSMAGVAVTGTLSLFFTGRSNVLGWFISAVLALVVVVVWWRLETSGEEDRRALLWLVFAGSAAMLLFGVVVFSLAGDIAGVTGVVVWVAIGPLLWLGARSPTRVDGRALAVSGVVWVLTGLAYLASFSAIASWLGTLEQADGASLLNVAGGGAANTGLLGLMGAVLAAGFEPVRRALRGVVDRLLFGDRPDPIGAATYVAGRAELGPLAVVEAVRESMALPYVGLFQGDEPLAESGEVTDNTRTLPVAGDAVLVVGVRSGDVRFGAQDRHALGVVVPLIAQVLRTEALADDLQKSRRETVALLEDERRRLRRDLHDGLGPRLSGMAYLADAARNSLRGNVEVSEDLLRQIRAEATETVAEIRRIVYGMRPPALDQLGLVPALTQAGEGLRHRDGRQIQVSVVAEGGLPDLGAAVEVAAYRIGVEAMVNAARHSGATRVRATLRGSGSSLEVEVEDDGEASAPWRPGVGLSSMAERAGLVGGTLEAGPTPSGGRVVAVLPLAAADQG
jgi:signal transduction histidine kinase